jgi:hypothetical protein
MRAAFSAILVALCTLSSPALGWVQSESSKGAKLFWDDPCQVMYVNEVGSDDVPDDTELTAIQNSLDTWTAVACSALSLQFAGETNFTVTGHMKEDPSINMIIFREKKWPYSTRPVAFTAVTYNVNTGEIFDADIEMNGEDYAFTTKPEAEPWKIDIQNTITHELGHVIGLDHTDEMPATMFEHAGPGETNKRTLEEDDTEGLCALYPEAEMTCAAVEPTYLFYDFPEPRTDEGCSASDRAHPLTALLAALALAVLMAARRKA